jgi:hypothetical protein
MPEETTDNSLKNHNSISKVATREDLLEWLGNPTINQDLLSSRISITISQDQTKEAYTIEAKGLAALTAPSQAKVWSPSNTHP